MEEITWKMEEAVEREENEEETEKERERNVKSLGERNLEAVFPESPQAILKVLNCLFGMEGLSFHLIL